MFFLGLLIGVLVVVLLGAVWFFRVGSSSPSFYDARAALHDIERRTIHDLMAEELTLYRVPGVKHPGTDIIEGTAVDVDEP